MEMYKIKSRDKEYIGIILSIDAETTSARTVFGDCIHEVLCYTVKIIPKDDTDIIIDNIIIHSLNDIVPYEE